MSETMSRDQVALELGITAGAVSKLYERNVLPAEKVGTRLVFLRQQVEQHKANGRSAGRPKLSTSKRAAIVSLRQRGDTVQSIATLLGVSTVTVRKYDKLYARTEPPGARLPTP